MTLLFCPRDQIVESQNNSFQMALKVEVDADPLHENSLDNSADSELLGMVDEGSFGSGAGDHQYLGAPKDEASAASYHFKDLSGAVTYKIYQMGDESVTAISSPTNGISAVQGNIPEYYVISEPVELLGSAPMQKQKVVKKPAPQPNKAALAKKRDDKRRATHNEVERRRRDKINTWITKLSALLPSSGLPDTASKGGILAKACDHIVELTERQKRMDKLEEDNDKLVLEILRLNQEMTELRKENTSMRSQLADNCIVLSHRPKGQKS